MHKSTVALFAKLGPEPGRIRNLSQRGRQLFVRPINDPPPLSSTISGSAPKSRTTTGVFLANASTLVSPNVSYVTDGTMHASA